MSVISPFAPFFPIRQHLRFDTIPHSTIRHHPNSDIKHHFDTITHSTPIAHVLKTTKIRIKKNPAEAGLNHLYGDTAASDHGFDAAYCFAIWMT